jgi:hypothetical protein
MHACVLITQPAGGQLCAPQCTGADGVSTISLSQARHKMASSHQEGVQQGLLLAYLDQTQILAGRSHARKILKLIVQIPKRVQRLME